VDNSAGDGRPSVKFAINEILSDDYKELTGFVVKKDNTVLSESGVVSHELTKFKYNKNSRNYEFTHGSTDHVNKSLSYATFYHQGHLCNGVLQRVNVQTDKKLEAMSKGAERPNSPRGAAGRPRNAGTLSGRTRLRLFAGLE
jgi:hypothetical protein